MFTVAVSPGKDLETLVRNALTHGELSLDVATAVEYYRTKSRLTVIEKRLLAILDSAIADGCIVPIQMPAVAVS